MYKRCVRVCVLFAAVGWVGYNRKLWSTTALTDYRTPSERTMILPAAFHSDSHAVARALSAFCRYESPFGRRTQLLGNIVPVPVVCKWSTVRICWREITCHTSDSRYSMVSPSWRMKRTSGNIKMVVLIGNSEMMSSLLYIYSYVTSIDDACNLTMNM